MTVHLHSLVRPAIGPHWTKARLCVGGATLTAVFGFIYFALLNTKLPSLVFLGIVLSLTPHDMMYGPQAALIAESFTGGLRYSGASLGSHLASLIGSGPAPLIATTWLFGKYNSGYVIAFFIFIWAVISVAAAAMFKSYTNRDISRVLR